MEVNSKTPFVLKYKGEITTNIVEALLWCNKQNSIEYNPYQGGDIICKKK